MLKKYAVIFLLALSAVGCTHTRVPLYKSNDSQLTTASIQAEMSEINTLIKDIQSKRGLSGRNIAMGILFWPGIIVNEYNASDALKAAEKRLKILSELYAKRQTNKTSTLASN